MIILGQLYNAFDPAWGAFLSRPFDIFSIPTEAVVFHAEFVVPRQARAYRTGLYLRDGMLYAHDALRRMPGFVGTYKEREIVMAEVWEDDGSDGHVEFRQRGWRFVPHDVLALRWCSWTKVVGLPEAMMPQFWDYEEQR